MLFNSYEFLMIFMPLVLAGFFFLGARGTQRLALGWLAAASLVFYAWWNPAFLALLGVSIFFNYNVGNYLTRAPTRGLLAFGIITNLAILSYFKYANFFLDTVGQLTGTPSTFEAIIMPIGISFFTFTQIAFLIDARLGLVKEPDFLRYLLFVTFFPHLIAGPILHHKEMMPQFLRPEIFKPDARNLALGATVFTVGLFKKVIVADSVAAFARPTFHAAAEGASPTFFDAWLGAISYALQLYYDFSGYSDMAIGLALLFNIALPLNFFSPYRAVNIIDYWRRWHMTLSRWLNDYIFMPLLFRFRHAGAPAVVMAVLVTFFLSGLWHGAGWTFVVWGCLHGMYILINLGWRMIRARIWGKKAPVSRGGVLAGWMLTMVAVVIAQVYFRATSIKAANAILAGMVGLHGVSLPRGLVGRFDWVSVLPIQYLGLTPLTGQITVAMVACVGGALAIALFAPNLYEMTAGAGGTLREVTLGRHLEPTRTSIWRPSPAWGVGIGVTAGLAFLGITQNSEFLYFHF